ncbi:MAG TPA: hypothetical protein VMN82_04960 [Thermoanaerobaculia bacterium]|nr:hypothetical protein [Thermoanaerobaculia bacterium]
MARVNKWIKRTGVSKHRGKLHRKLGYAPREHIPTSVLVKHSHGNSTEAHEARFALLARGYYTGKPFKHHHGPRRKAHHYGHTR